MFFQNNYIEYSSNKIGSIWIPFLLREGYIGEVVNVFRRTINIRNTNNTLLSITALNYYSPIYINIPSNVFINFQEVVKPYSPVFIRKPYIIVGRLKIHYNINTRTIYSTQICHMCNIVSSFTADDNFLLKIYKRISFIIDIVDKSDNIIEMLRKASLTSNIKELLLELKKTLKRNGNSQKKYMQISEKFYSILGLGYGVTPSSDDYVGGLLGVINTYLACNYKKPLILDLRRVLSRTNWVSGYLLYYNHVGLFNNIFEDFIAGIFRKELARSIDAFISLLSIGHTSGLDMALGALGGFAIIGSLKGCEKCLEEYFSLFYENLS